MNSAPIANSCAPTRAQRLLTRSGSSHVAGEMHHGVAIRDIDIELVERVAAKVLEVLLHLHFDIVPREGKSVWG